MLDGDPGEMWAHSWMASAGLEDAGSWEGRSWTKEVGAGVGWKEVEPGKLFFQGAEPRAAESGHDCPQGWAVKWEGQV